MKIDLVEKLISYISDQLYALEAPCSTIRIIKFLYLIDIDYYQRHKHLLTEIEWVRYKYGPYFFAMPDVIRTSKGLEVFERPTENGFVRTFRTTKSQSISSIVDFSTEQLIQNTIKKWSHVSLDDFLKYVYATPPMKRAEFGKPLDFATLFQHAKTEHKQWHLQLNPEDSIRIQSQLAQRSNSYKMNETKYDELYLESIKIMDKEESEECIVQGQIKVESQLDDLLLNQLE